MISPSQSLEVFASKLAAEPEYMAWVLAAFSTQEELHTLDEIAERLSIGRSSLTRLAMCKRHRPDVEDFNVWLHKVASFVGVDAKELAFITRQVEFFETANALPSADFNQLLAAARDRTSAERKQTPKEPAE
jgi:hypothetical protein